MRIGGFQALTLSDYPGHIAAIIFTQGCNFRCPFCHNGALLATDAPVESLQDEETILDTLESRRTLLDGVVISGGEPTIQSDLGEFIDRVKQKGLQVKLDTNGSRPDVVRDLLAHHLLDYVAMDIKAPFTKYSQLVGVDAPIDRIEETLRLLIAGDTPCEFRTTFVPGLLTKEDLEAIQAGLPTHVKYTVQPFVPDNALDTSLQSHRKHPNWSSPTPASVDGPDRMYDIPHHIDWLSGE